MSTKIQLLLLALLFAAGVLLGHLVTSSSAEAKTAAEARADSLIGNLRDAHALEVAALRDSATAALGRAKALADAARRSERNRTIADAIADSLRRTTAAIDAALAEAQTQADSLPLLLRKIDGLSGELAHAHSQVSEERANAAQWKSADEEVMRANAALQRTVETDSTRIVELESTIAELRRPGRLTLRLGRWELKACAQYQVARVGRVGAGPTVCLR